MKHIMNSTLLVSLLLLTACVEDESYLDGSIVYNKTEKLDNSELCLKLYITNLSKEQRYKSTYTSGGGTFKLKNEGDGHISLGLDYSFFSRSNFAQLSQGQTSSNTLGFAETTSLEVPYVLPATARANDLVNAKMTVGYTGLLAPYKMDDDFYHNNNILKATFNQINCGKIIFLTIQATGGNQPAPHNPITYTEVDVHGLMQTDKTTELKRITKILDDYLLGKNIEEIKAATKYTLAAKAKLTGNYKPVVKDTINTLLASQVRSAETSSEENYLPENIKDALVNHFSKVLTVVNK